MSVVSGQWSAKHSKSSNSNGAKITAPNGSVISRNSNNASIMSSPVKSVSGGKKSIQGSIISQAKSATLSHRSSKGASILSGVSSQVARRKKQREQSENASQSINVRAMSATSLNRRQSNESQNISDHLKRYSQSDASIAIKSEIQSMTKAERDILRNTIDKYKMYQNIEKNRNIALVRKIKEIQSLRPPYSEFQTNVCYICQRTFWPIIFVKYSCNRCQIFVCKNCLKPYNSNTICNQCFQEMIYLSKSDLLLKKRKDNDDSDSDNHIDVDALTKIITQTEKNEDAYSYNQMDPYLDHIDESAKSSSSSGMNLFKKLLHKRKSDSVSLTKSRSELSLECSELSGEKKKFDSISMTSLTIVNSSAMLNLADHSESDVLRGGEIMIGVSYNFNSEEFRVIIKKCKDLEIAIPNQKSSNSYVKVNLVPPIANEKVHKTKVVNSNLNPEFNEHCRYKHIKYDDVIARTVLITVWHSERLGKDVFLGQVHLKLSSLSLDDATPQWHKLRDKKPTTIHPTLSKYYGDIQFSIKYSMTGDVMSDISQTEDGSDMSFSSRSIILWIKQANNLLTSSYSSLPNAYVKCLILPETSKVPAKKSPIIRKNFNPIWNIPFPFTNIPLEDLAKSGMEITVWDKRSGLLRDIFLGGISLNISRSGRLVPNNEVEVWQRMIDKPGTWIEAKIVLRKDLK